MSTPDVFLPLLYKVRLHNFDPNAVNDRGNEVERWDPPVEQDVYGWGPPQLTASAKEVIVGGTRYVVEVELMVPPGFYAKDGDRIQLGNTLEVEAHPERFDMYRVVGPIEDYSHNPMPGGWNPGNVVNLIAVGGVR